MGGSVQGRNVSQANFADDQLSMATYHRGTSVPAKYQQAIGRGVEKDLDPDFGKPWIPKRKRGAI
jgi:hypothetical protein